MGDVWSSGDQGVPYEFNARKVAAWKKANTVRFEDGRQARADENAAQKLDLFGSTSVDPSRHGLCPRDQTVAI